jgi:hypothetical protein
MELRYQCNLADYQEALLSRDPKPVEKKILYSLIGCVFAVLSMATMANLGVRQGMAAVVLIVIFLLFWLVWQPVCQFLLRRDFEKNPNFSMEQVVSVDDDGLHFTSEIDRSDVKWHAYSRSRETKNLLLLFQGPRLFQVFPKRAFSDKQLDEFRSLLNMKITGGR